MRSGGKGEVEAAPPMVKAIVVAARSPGVRERD
jgi:hypothetical protein